MVSISLHRNGIYLRSMKNIYYLFHLLSLVLFLLYIFCVVMFINQYLVALIITYYTVTKYSTYLSCITYTKLYLIALYPWAFAEYNRLGVMVTCFTRERSGVAERGVCVGAV